MQCLPQVITINQLLHPAVVEASRQVTYEEGAQFARDHGPGTLR